MSIRILLVDDHAVMRAGLRRLLENERGMEVIGDTGDGHSAVRLAQQTAPDVVLMDIGMADLNGIEATRQIVTSLPATKVVCLSMHREKELIDAVLKAGAAGYVLKDEAPEVVADAVRVVAGGGNFLCPAIAGDVVRRYSQKAGGTISGAFAVLSGRELEVLQMIAEGHSTKAIAAKLRLSAKTVAVHREHIMAKLNLHSVVELARFALREGLSKL